MLATAKDTLARILGNTTLANFRLRSDSREENKKDKLEKLDKAWQRFEMSHNEAICSAYAPKADSGIFMQTPLPWLSKIVLDRELSPNSNILDIGTGNGMCALQLHILTGAKVHSVECDQKRYEGAMQFREFLAQETGNAFPGVTFEQSNALTHSFTQYNLVYFFATLPAGQHDLCEKLLTKCSLELQRGAYMVCPNFRFAAENAGKHLDSTCRREKVQALGFRETSLGATWNVDGMGYGVLVVGK